MDWLEATKVIENALNNPLHAALQRVHEMLKEHVGVEQALVDKKQEYAMLAADVQGHKARLLALAEQQAEAEALAKRQDATVTEVRQAIEQARAEHVEVLRALALEASNVRAGLNQEAAARRQALDAEIAMLREQRDELRGELDALKARFG